MPVRSGVLSLKLNSPEAAAVRKALAADQRIRLLEMLATRTLNVNEIPAGLGGAPPAASTPVRAAGTARWAHTGQPPAHDAGSRIGAQPLVQRRLGAILLPLSDPVCRP